MSRFAAAIATLLTCASCALSDSREQDVEKDETHEKADAASNWIEDLQPLIETNQELEEKIFTQWFRVNCAQGPLSTDSREEVLEKCEETSPGGRPIDAKAIAEALESELIPQADRLAGALEALDRPDDDELKAIHDELLTHWQDRVSDFQRFLDAWQAEDMDALDTAFERRMRNRRAAGQWLLRSNEELAELGLLLEL